MPICRFAVAFCSLVLYSAAPGAGIEFEDVTESAGLVRPLGLAAVLLVAACQGPSVPEVPTRDEGKEAGRAAPAEATTPSHVLLHRAGYIRPVGAGIYDYLPLAWRTLRVRLARSAE